MLYNSVECHTRVRACLSYVMLLECADYERKRPIEFFEANGSIWTYNCPCPSSSHTKKTHHVCRFKDTAAVCLDPWWTIDNHKQFITLRALFHSMQASTYNRGDTTTTTEHTVATVEEPAPADIPMSRVDELFAFTAEIGLRVRPKMCFNGARCRIREKCPFAHSIDEMLSVFEDERVCQFYREARIKDCDYMPRPGKLEVNTLRSFRCTRNCKRKEEEEEDVYPQKNYVLPPPDLTRLVFYKPGNNDILVYPYVMVCCRECKRVNKVAIYS